MQLTDDTRQTVAGIARRHGFGADAAELMLAALMRGGGTQAQFDHPDFGGMGQWSGGMLMIGDMFNSGLKARTEALIRDLLPLAASVEPQPSAAAWPSDLGTPSASGSQNGVDYAVFPAARRLAVRRGGELSLYDTGDHRIGGVSQQQGGSRSLRFDSQHGPVPLDSLARIAPAAAAGPADSAPAAGASIPAAIEQLHALLVRGILTQAEFDAKKADLLGRL